MSVCKDAVSGVEPWRVSVFKDELSGVAPWPVSAFSKIALMVNLQGGAIGEVAPLSPYDLARSPPGLDGRSGGVDHSDSSALSLDVLFSLEFCGKPDYAGS